MNRSFNEKWCEEFPWVRRNVENGKPMCLACKATLQSKKTALRDHAETVKHKNNILIDRKQVSITNFTISDQIKKAELILTLHIVNHSAFRTIDHLGEMISGHFGGLKVLLEYSFSLGCIILVKILPVFFCWLIFIFYNKYICGNVKEHIVLEIN